MKKSFIAIMTIVLCLLMASGVSAAGKAPEKPVQVMLNGEAITFLEEPVILNDFTYVEFRTLFEKFGYEIEYIEYTRTIKAESPMHKIEMSLDGDVAFVDGKVVPSAGQMKIVHDRTMVGVRFIATLSGKDIGWDGANRIVTITDFGPTPEQQAEVLRLFDKILEMEAAGDAQGMAALFTSDTPIEVKAQLSDFGKAKTKTEYLERLIQTNVDDEAVVLVKDQTIRVSGAFFADNRTTMKYTLHKDADGQWKIYNMELQGIEFLTPEKWFDLAVTVPETEKAAMNKLLKDQIDAANNEDLDAYLATMTFDSDDQKQASTNELKYVFAQVDMKASLSKSAIVEFEAGKSATLLTVMAGEVNVNGAMMKTESTQLSELKNVDGKWLFSPNSVVVSTKQL